MIVAPSFLAANFLRLQEAIDMVESSEAAWIHLDVMDGRFVPNISYGMPVIEAICKASTRVCDVHLMIEQPEHYLETFRKLGADVLTIHVENNPHLHRQLQVIRSLGAMAGIAINPHTPLSAIEWVLDSCDLVNIMSVNPGFGGQKFIPSALQKIEALSALIKNKGLNVLIEVDGGVTLENAAAVAAAGAHVLVAGSSVFGAENPVEAIARLASLS